MTGARMASEMAEQPQVLRALAARHGEIAAVVRGVAPPALQATVLLARGSSDHAAVLGRYLIELATGRPVALAAPSLTTLYDAPHDYRGVLVVAASQSGRTPEIVTVLERLQRAGARGLAITNDASSALARTAHGAICLEAGPELAVPATKTVTTQLLAFALVARGLAGPGMAVSPVDPRDAGAGVWFGASELARLAGAVAEVLDDPQPAEDVASALEAASRSLTTARGLLYAAALEAALKLKEATGVHAEALSAADLRHGPIAVADGATPVLAFSGQGPAAADIDALAEELRARGAPVHRVPLPTDVPEALLAIPAVVRAQQVALFLARRRGIDPDAPHGLRKVTPTH